MTTTQTGISGHPRMLINGDRVRGARTVGVINPATGLVIGQSPVADRAQVDEAVAAARAAFPAWAAAPHSDRSKAVFALADAIEARIDDIADLVVVEQGKPLAQAKMDVEWAVGVARYFAGLPYEPTLLRDDETGRVELRRKPFGVVAAIIPWNFPFYQAVFKVCPAILAGNTVVLKPSPTTPLNAMLLGELLQNLVPAGVVNIVGDDGSVGPQLTAHPEVDAVTFTGSTAVGKQVMREAADTMKRVTLELGGNDAAIVLPDVDLDEVAPQLFTWAFFNAGQVCIAIKRIFAHSSIYEELVGRLADLARSAKVGEGHEPGVEIGPLQNAKQFEAAKRWLEIANKEGKIVSGGQVVDRDGYFVQPTIVRDIDESSSLIVEETFGPIRSVIRYEDIDEAIARANSTTYALGGSVWSSDTTAAAEIAGRLESGNVWVNQHCTLFPDVPYGGHKQSGIGLEFGASALEDMSNSQSVYLPPSQTREN
jgi:aldehyde dehydrogenase (NAD+)